jgi:hypothetical protein
MAISIVLPVALGFGVRELLALLDTGAFISCLSPSVWADLLSQPGHGFSIVSKMWVEVAGGRRLQVDVSSPIPVRLSGRVFEHSFAILEMAGHPVIIGMDFLCPAGAVIHCAAQRVVFEDNGGQSSPGDLPEGFRSPAIVASLSSAGPEFFPLRVFSGRSAIC